MKTEEPGLPVITLVKKKFVNWLVEDIIAEKALIKKNWGKRDRTEFEL